MKKQNNIENELNKIRVDFYERTKDMSPSERVAYIKAKVAPLHEKHGIYPVREISPDRRRMQKCSFLRG